MAKRIVFYIFLILILTDLSYSFVQHLQMPMDGDMAESILPAKGYEKIFQDPFGISVITENAVYPNPNRFFAQWMYAKYFQLAPFALQNFVSPIESIYYSSAIAKIVTQIFILLLFGFYITGKRKILSLEFFIAVLLIIPLFQTNGYSTYMGIIDSSITYTFSYALPCALLLLFYLPFFNSSFYQKNISTNKIFLLILFLFTIVLTFNGPLIPGAVLVVTLLYFSYHFFHNYKNVTDSNIISKAIKSLKQIPQLHFFYFSIISIFSLYSLYIGNNNSQFIHEKISVYQRYCRLPDGLYYLLTQKIGYPLLLSMIGLNAFLISKYYKSVEGNKILSLLKWIGFFALLYILLLPLGGYRSYRANIIRYDSILPITLSLFLIYGLSSYYLLGKFKNRSKKIYALALIAISLIFSIADELKLGKNSCEKMAFQQLSNSKENVVLIENDCTVLAWDKITDKNASSLNGQLLQYWGITEEKKQYYQK